MASINAKMKVIIELLYNDGGRHSMRLSMVSDLFDKRINNKENYRRHFMEQLRGTFMHIFIFPCSRASSPSLSQRKVKKRTTKIAN